MVFRKGYFYFLTLLLLAIWLAVFSLDSDLHIISCNVGQGDATLIQIRTTQVLIDGGPGNRVLECLGKYMPFYDRTIEMVILTHPEEDHYGGLVDVFKNYRVLIFGHNNQNSGSQGYQVLKNLVGSKGVESIYLYQGKVLRSDLIQLDVVWPMKDTNLSKTNDEGIVTLLKYKQFKAIFMADVENNVSDQIAGLNQMEQVNYVKVNHHGSKNGISEKLIQVLKPKIAVISVSAKNSYGHPHQEVIDLLKKYNLKILRTDQVGDVEIEISDGNYVVNN